MTNTEDAKEEPSVTQTRDDIKADKQGFVDVVKLTLSLATGALVFSVGLTNTTEPRFSLAMKMFLIIAWIAFGVSIVFGLFAQMYLADPDFKRSDSETITSAQGNQIAFGIGAALVAVILVWTLYSGPERNAGAMRTEVDAIAKAATRIPVGKHITKVASATLDHGFDPMRPEQNVWHIQFEMRADNEKVVVPAKPPQVLDVYVDPIGERTPYSPPNER